MKKYNQLILPILLLVGLQTTANAQVQFSLEQNQKLNLYEVGIATAVTMNAPMNRVANAQFILKFSEFNEQLEIEKITSLIDGVGWSVSSEFLGENIEGDYALYAIAMEQLSTSNIPIVKDAYLPLFSLQMKNEECVGTVELISNESEEVLSAREARLNLTQNFSLLGAGGNAYNGFLNSIIECASITNVEEIVDLNEVKVFPNPVQEDLNISWALEKPIRNLEIEIYDVLGKLIRIEAIENPLLNGIHEIKVKHFAEGAYLFHIIADNKSLHRQKVLVLE